MKYEEYAAITKAMRPQPYTPEWGAYWKKDIELSQQVTHYAMNGEEYLRIPYGQEPRIAPYDELDPLVRKHFAARHLPATFTVLATYPLEKLSDVLTAEQLALLKTHVASMKESLEGARRFAPDLPGPDLDDNLFIGYPGHCHDCNVAKGQLHVPGCDTEICPKCYGQAISCGCEEEDEH